MNPVVKLVDCQATLIRNGTRLHSDVESDGDGEEGGCTRQEDMKPVIMFPKVAQSIEPGDRCDSLSNGQAQPLERKDNSDANNDEAQLMEQEDNHRAQSMEQRDKIDTFQGMCKDENAETVVKNLRDLLVPGFVQSEVLIEPKRERNDSYFIETAEVETSACDAVQKCQICEGLFIGHEALIQHLYTHCVKKRKRKLRETSTNETSVTEIFGVPCRKNNVDEESNLKSEASSGGSESSFNGDSTTAIDVPELLIGKDRPLIKPVQNEKRQIRRKTKCFICDKCDKRMMSEFQLKVHCYQAHDGEPPYQCKHCEKRFGTQQDCVEHAKTHVFAAQPVNGDYQCDKCDETFIGTQKDMFLVHCRSHKKERPHKCEECGKGFTKKFLLTQHRVTHTGEKPYRCDQCGKAFTQGGNLRTHIRSYHKGEKPHPCDVCGKRFTRKDDLKVHRMIHTGERPFQCDICGAAFQTRRVLRVHSYGHSGIRPHKCDVCDKGFRTRTQMVEHYRTHTDYRPYKCDFCDLAFVRPSNLRNHMVLHSDAKQFKCEFCEMAFHKKSGLISHRRRHTAETPFKCDQCGQAFAHRASLAAHLSKHAGIKHACDVCGKAYTRKADMTRHRRVTHEQQ